MESRTESDRKRSVMGASPLKQTESPKTYTKIEIGLSVRALEMASLSALAASAWGCPTSRRTALIRVSVAVAEK